MKVRFIINPIAGRHSGRRGMVDEITDAVTRVFSGVSGLFEIKVSLSRDDAFRLSMEAAKRGYDTVFACGGDGTINAVASAIVNSGTSLGIIPAGSGGGLARALGIPLDAEKAMGVLLKGRVRRIDAGSADNGRFFFSTAGIGLDAAVSKRYGDWAKRRVRRGSSLSLPAVLKEYIFYRPGNLTVKWGGGNSLRARPLFFTVANTSGFGASAVIAPSAVPDDGLFDVCVAEPDGFLNALSMARRLFNGRIDRMERFKTIRTDAVEVDREGPGLLHVDGTVFEAGRTVTFRMLPKALGVWAF
ncbi:MAG: diacylglycerol kinase family lipid kinase [Deltaproteobacteria bacterium]|nr:diacylglycerol kinase family lipid kinase [Deltaproteobacteria bacterium]